MQPALTTAPANVDVVAWLAAAPVGTLVLASEIAARLTAPHLKLVEHATPDAVEPPLTAAEAAARLGLSRQWLYRNAAALPFTIRVGRTLRFDAAKLERWLAKRTGSSLQPR